MKVPVRIFAPKLNKALMPAMAMVLALAVLAPGSGRALAEENQPVTVVVHGIEVTSDIPPIMMRGRVYLPDRFVADILGYPFKWEPKTRSMRMGVPQAGVDMVGELPAYTGKPLARPGKVKSKSYAAGFEIDAKNTVRWSLKGMIDSVTFSFGMPDGHRGGSVGFTLLADGKIVAEESVYKENGLKKFTFNVSGVKILTVKYYDNPGGILINPQGYQT
jgi:Copper amine oxidase N-terminal domain./NPCBM/NEW2 domain.